ncbi:MULTISPECIES: iron-sulfur cluster repair di-iron protein [Bacteroides]|uniref:iron-sulfur cluster repair di-iron protein n=1 Tax=Bacteroides TaxID=816 RepID=UPI0004B3774C|nr:iron-sulfur cluster repair di-iron protein [Bacteroides neonati]
MKNFSEMTVGEIVAENFKYAWVFNRYKVDFCCNGSIPLSEACKQANINMKRIIEELEESVSTLSPGVPDYKSWPTVLLVDYVIKYHHRNIRIQGPEITELLDKICQVHGDSHPELYEVQESFAQSLVDLNNHLQKEEMVLYPYIYELCDTYSNSAPSPCFHCGSIESPIAVMMAEHDTEGERYRHIAYLTKGYVTPNDGCNTYRLALDKLKAFEEALHEHIHLENNIIFPRAIDMEETSIR